MKTIGRVDIAFQGCGLEDFPKKGRLRIQMWALRVSKEGEV